VFLPVFHTRPYLQIHVQSTVHKPVTARFTTSAASLSEQKRCQVWQLEGKQRGDGEISDSKDNEQLSKISCCCSGSVEHTCT